MLQYPRNRREFMDFTRRPFPNVPPVEAEVVTDVSDPSAPFAVRFERITPERAAYLLSQRSKIDFGNFGGKEGLAVTGNRALNFTRVEQYVREIRSGSWRTTHQGIALDEDGLLIDGQHRLWAIILTREPQVMLVSEGVPSATFYLVDQGLSRTAAAFVRGAHAGARTTLARNLMYWSHLAHERVALTQTNVRVKVGIATHEVLQFLAENPAINAYGLEYAAKANKYAAAFPEFGGTALLLAGYLAGDHEQFWQDVEAVFENTGLPVTSVVSYMTKLRTAKVAVPTGERDEQNRPIVVWSSAKEYTLAQTMRAILLGLAYQAGVEVPKGTGGIKAQVPPTKMPPKFEVDFHPENYGIKARPLDLSHVNLTDFMDDEDEAQDESDAA